MHGSNLSHPSFPKRKIFREYFDLLGLDLFFLFKCGLEKTGQGSTHLDLVKINNFENRCTLLELLPRTNNFENTRKKI
jgi:hypothetical protein